MRVAVIGLGLIGGSIAIAARGRLGAHVAGMDRERSVRDEALACGAVDRVCDTVAEAVDGAHAAFVAVPVGALADSVATVLEHADGDCVVSDVGSTKRAVVAAHKDPRFIGGHPLAGSESSGLAHACGDMFNGATWYLTPTPATPLELLERLRSLVQAIGAHPREIDPESHDKLVATVSHLPHVLANALVAQAASTVPTGDAGPSFRDATRVAGAPGEIWTDIYMTNADLLAHAVGDMIVRLSSFREALLASDRARIAAFSDAPMASRARPPERPR